MPELITPGPILLFGSGETSPSGRKAFEWAFKRLPPSPKLALLGTPAGFEPNSDRVIGRVADFIQWRLQNYDPQIEVVPARQRGTASSPDGPEVAAPLQAADLIFMGPGSPTYAVRQLQDSRAWHALVASHRRGAALALASAAAVAAGALALPVYEIYKAGEDLHWKPGLDFFGAFGLPLAFIPHWNNTDGGEELDTSRCFMGRARFERLLALLPEGLTVVGVDENTTLILDLQAQVGRVTGVGNVTLLAHPEGKGPRTGEPGCRYHSGQCFPLEILGDFVLPEPDPGLPEAIWAQAKQVAGRVESASQFAPQEPGDWEPPAEVSALLEQREAARRAKDWAAADALRRRIAALGWQVLDTPDGPRVKAGRVS